VDNTKASDPFETLGVPRNASEAEVRARYLELVRQFPPEREPSRFREIRAAFEAASDPLVLAMRLLQPPGAEPPEWTDAIEEHKRRPPALTPDFLLSLGNRDTSPEASQESQGE
jgi:hypothetical protein